MEIDKNLYKDIKEYCDLNGLKPREYINGLLKKAFITDKYGDRPFVDFKKEQEEEKEIIKDIEEKTGEEYKPVDTSEIIFDSKKYEPVYDVLQPNLDVKIDFPENTVQKNEDIKKPTRRKIKAK